MSSTLNLQRTLAIIKPHAIHHRSAIIRRIQIAGFQILQERHLKLTQEQVMKFFQHKQNDYRKSMNIESLSSGPVIVLCLARQNAIELWNQLMGPEVFSFARQSAPTSLRALYSDPVDKMRNAVYGTECTDDIQHELQFFFPNMTLETIGTAEETQDYLCKVIINPLCDALYEMIKIRPNDPLEWLAIYMLEHNTNKPFIRATSSEMVQRVRKMKEHEAMENQQNTNGTLQKRNCGCSLRSDGVSNSMETDCP